MPPWWKPRHICHQIHADQTVFYKRFRMSSSWRSCRERHLADTLMTMPSQTHCDSRKIDTGARAAPAPFPATSGSSLYRELNELLRQNKFKTKLHLQHY